MIGSHSEIDGSDEEEEFVHGESDVHLHRLECDGG